MRRLAFVFPGQGAQYVGMCRDLHAAYPCVREIFERASEVLGYDLSRICFEGPEEELNKTSICQVALLVSSWATLTAFKAKACMEDLPAYATCGLSLGEYTAHLFAGSLSFDDAVRLVEKRGRYMQEACDRHRSSMTSILGLERQVVEEICRKSSEAGVINIANINSPDQIAISGAIPALEKAEMLAKEYGAKRVIRLKVAGAFHSPLMREAEERMREELSRVEFRIPRIPVVANATAQYVRTPEETRATLSKQITSSVLWSDSIQHLGKDGVTGFYEFGAGKVLTGLIRKILPTAEVHNITDVPTLDAEASAFAVEHDQARRKS